MVNVGQVTTAPLNVLGLQVLPKGTQVKARARTEVRSQVEAMVTRSVTIISPGVVPGGPTVFVATSASVAGETTPNPPVTAPPAKQQWQGRPAPLPALKVDFWANNLPKLYDGDRSRSLMSQLLTGVRIGRPPADTQIVSANWPSAIEHREQVSKIIADDLGAGRLHGPFEAPPFDNFIVSPLGAFKKRGSNKIRLIHDLSFPSKGSVNSLIKKEDFSLAYASVDDAVRICKSLGPGPVYMAKLDLENAFKHVLVDKRDWHMLGFSWPDSNGRTQYFFSKVLNFGLRSAPFLFDMFAEALLGFMHHVGVPRRIVRYVDDFIVVAPTAHECQQHLDTMLVTCRASGFSVQPSKITTPAVSTEFLGIVIDSSLQQLRISVDRLRELTTEVAAWLELKRATKRRLLSLIGKLAFAAKVVRSGRAFLGRLLGIAKQAKALHHHVRLTEEARADLLWWHQCIASHNGIYYYDIDWNRDDVTHIYTDASNTAFGGVCNSEWFQISYTGRFQAMLDRSINWREFYAAVAALATWAKSLAGKPVVFHIDNTTTCCILNKLYSPVKELMKFTREWCLLIEQYNISVAVVYIDTKSNVDADDLSRLHTQDFLDRNPGANRYMTWPTLGHF